MLWRWVVGSDIGLVALGHRLDIAAGANLAAGANGRHFRDIVLTLKMETMNIKNRDVQVPKKPELLREVLL